MNSTRASVHSLFRNKVQYQVPLYQRRYVWNKTNWKTLWENILDQKKLKAVGDRGHFTGPIVTRLIEKQQNRFEVIDGQQRLTTFQIIFCVIRDLCSKSPSLCEFEEDAENHVKNGDTAIENLRLQDPLSELPEPIYKFIPTDYDNLAFKKIVQREYGRAILTASSVEEARAKVFGEEKFSHRILDAYDYFYTVIRDLEEISNEIPNLLETIKNNLDLVQITPGRSQQAEKIFESVNATGRNLSEFDYLRNNLFLRADDKSATLYKGLWFENDPDYDWSDNRLESFFQAFLMAKLGPNALNDNVKLFDVYRQNLEISGPDIKKEFIDLNKYAVTYKELDVEPDFKSRMQFYKDLRTFYTYEEEERYNPVQESEYDYYITVIRSFIMYLQVELGKSKNEILHVFEILESYVARSLLVDTVAGYHVYQAIRSFFSGLFRIQDAEFSIENMLEYLADKSKRKWISNTVIGNWFSGKEYHNFRGWLEQAHRFSLRYIFYRIENWKRECVGEGEERLKPLNFTEEEFPIDRHLVYTLSQLSHSQVGWSYGNLTFCWTDTSKQKFNKSGPKEELLGKGLNGTLKLNSEICDKPDWGPRQIKEREKKLFNIFSLIWGDKDQLIGAEVWKDIRTRYPDDSEVEGLVVGSDKKGIRVELESGIEGTVDVSEIAWDYDNIIPSERFTRSDSVTVKVLGISEAEQKISLSIKRTQPNPWENIKTKYPVGSEVEGLVVRIDKKGMHVELESGIKGRVDVSEIAWNQGNIIPSGRFKPGDSVTVKVLGISEAEQKISLSIKRTQPNPWENIKTKYPVGSEVQGTIVKINKSNAILQLEDDVEGVIKREEMGWFNKPNIQPSEIVEKGEEINVKILEILEEKGEISLSIKETQPNPWTQIPEKYKVGSIVRGKITNLTNFGAFAELAKGIKGLIHISELANTRIQEPGEVVSVKDELDLKVIEFNQGKKRIGLSLKAVSWEKFTENNKVGSIVRGKICDINDHGAFAELAKGISGLIHISEFANRGIDRPGEVVSVKDELDLKVIEFNQGKKQIRLSLKAASWEKFTENNWEKFTEDNKVGSIVRGKITNLTDFGAFAELAKGIKGLIHISELSDRGIDRPEKIVSPGDELDLTVINMNLEKRQIGLSLKAMVKSKKSRRKPLPRNRRVNEKNTTLLEKFGNFMTERGRYP